MTLLNFKNLTIMIDEKLPEYCNSQKNLIFILYLRIYFLCSFALARPFLSIMLDSHFEHGLRCISTA